MYKLSTIRYDLGTLTLECFEISHTHTHINLSKHSIGSTKRAHAYTFLDKELTKNIDSVLADPTIQYQYTSHIQHAVAQQLSNVTPTQPSDHQVSEEPKNPKTLRVSVTRAIKASLYLQTVTSITDSCRNCSQVFFKVFTQSAR